jgi:uncharacterized protein YoxC
VPNLVKNSVEWVKEDERVILKQTTDILHSRRHLWSPVNRETVEFHQRVHAIEHNLKCYEIAGWTRGDS